MKKGLIIALIAIVIIGSGAYIFWRISNFEGNNDNTQEQPNDNDDDNDNQNGNNDNQDDDNDQNDDDNGTTDPNNDNNNDGDGNTNTPGNNTTTPIVRTGALCSSNDYVNIFESLSFCITSQGVLKVKANVNQVGSSTGNILYAAPALLNADGAALTFSEPIKNIARYYPGNGEGLEYLGLSIITTASGKAYLINNNVLFQSAKIEVHAPVYITEKIVSFASPDKSVSCIDAACHPSTTVTTASGKVYIVYDDGYYKAK